MESTNTTSRKKHIRRDCGVKGGCGHSAEEIIFCAMVLMFGIGILIFSLIGCGIYAVMKNFGII